MNIQTIHISAINPAQYNPRAIDKDEFDGLVHSLKIFGQQENLIVNKDMTLISGHMRLEAAKRLGWAEMVCNVVDVDKATEKKLNVVMNSQAISGRYDDLKLAEILEELKLDPDYLPLRLDQLEPLDLSEPEADEDEELEHDDETPAISKKGEIYQLGSHLLMCGDATNSDDIEALLDGSTPDLVFADPPYGIAVVKGSKVGADFGVAKKGDYQDVIGDDTSETAKLFYAACEESGLMPPRRKFILWGGNYFADFLPFSDSWLIWDKRSDTGIRNSFADAEMAWCSFHTPIRIYTQLWNGMIREGEKGKRLHPTQKPVKMLGKIITDFTKKGEVVFDGFGGSGSTLIACEQVNRLCLMMELDPKYCDTIRRRYHKFVNETEDGWEAATPRIND